MEGDKTTGGEENDGRNKTGASSVKKLQSTEGGEIQKLDMISEK